MSELQLRQICFFFLLAILLTVGACAAPVYPRYQPAAEDSLGAARLCKNCFGTVPQHGYSDYQIDERTYIVTYQGFNPAGIGPWRYLPHEEWIAMTHDYVLYRSAELARSKGARQFVILHRDDSNQAWRVWKRYRDRYGRYDEMELIMGFTPGARVLIRLFADQRASILESDGQVHEVDTLMARLTKSNAELSNQQGVGLSHNYAPANDRRFVRWRVPVLLDDTGLEPSLRNRKSSLLDTEIIEDTRGVFKVVQWSRSPLSPIDLLRECIRIADQEGYPVYKLEDWTTAEYRPGRSWNDWNDWSAWFRTKARLVLQHQSEPNSLDPVFVVDEIRENVMR